jgi:hypothetical protein
MIDVEAIRKQLNATIIRREINFSQYRKEIFAAVRQWKREQREEKDRLGNMELIRKLEAGGLTLYQELRLKLKLIDRWWKQTMRREGLTHEQLLEKLADRVENSRTGDR